MWCVIYSMGGSESDDYEWTTGGSEEEELGMWPTWWRPSTEAGGGRGGGRRGPEGEGWGGGRAGGEGEGRGGGGGGEPPSPMSEPDRTSFSQHNAPHSLRPGQAPGIENRFPRSRAPLSPLPARTGAAWGGLAARPGAWRPPYCPDWDDIERIPWMDLLGEALTAAPDAGQVRPYAPYFFEGSVVVGLQCQLGEYAVDLRAAQRRAAADGRRVEAGASTRPLLTST